MPAADLSSIPLFASLPVDEIRRLERRAARFAPARLAKCSSRKVIRMTSSTSCWKARWKWSRRLASPEERLLGLREAGNLLGEMSLFSQDGCHTASVRAVTPLRLLKVTPDRTGCPVAPPAATGL